MMQRRTAIAAANILLLLLLRLMLQIRIRADSGREIAQNKLVHLLHQSLHRHRLYMIRRLVHCVLIGAHREEHENASAEPPLDVEKN